MGTRVLLVTERDTITGKLKSGPGLRIKYGVPGYTYEIMTDKFSQSNYIRNITFNKMTSFYMLVKALFLRSQVVNTDAKFIHSFFWTFYRYRRPWIHENDQSPSQAIMDYMKIKNGFGEKVASMLGAVLNEAEFIITWSQWAGRGFRNDGVGKEKIKIIPLPYETKPFKSEHDGINVLFIGRDLKRKGGDSALKIMERISRERKGVRMLYVGKGVPDKHEWLKYYSSVSSAFLDNRIFPIADIFLFPTREEAYGIAALEALAHGVPVVSSRAGALGEIIDDGVNGFSGSSDDALHDRLLKLIDSDSLRSDMSKRALEKVSTAHDPVKISKMVKEVYDKI
ncbi:MAG: glycosyltransferase family 4 protein [Nitrososphaerota archaeon]|nr:glycosyltransferase family 4 protein [Nitrososphaerota archaeon]MDG6932306.1 glycosyltransferase family 4 protein [Nitrososphaerota archaeon]MDG6936482.1 glycosyltransferase family 4 protein [Nitrososphaerota archaeon]